MPIEFDVNLKVKDMFRVNMHQTYTGFSGFLSIFSSVLLFGMAIYTYEKVTLTYTVLYVFFGVILLVYQPLTLWLRAKQSIKVSPVLSNTLHYMVNEDGFTVTQGEANGVLAWKQIYKMVATKKLVLVYSNRIHAYVIPREQLGEYYVPLAKLARTKLPKYRLKMKVTIKDV